MAEWLYEAGIGENRAALIEDGEIVEALIEWNDLRWTVGAIAEARIAELDRGRGRGIVTLPDGSAAILDPLPPPPISQGERRLVEIVREPITERDRRKWPKARLAEPGTETAPGTTLEQRIRQSGSAPHTLRPGEADLLEAAGWSELIEQAASGRILFPGGSLHLTITPAMALFDVDGALPPVDLALAGADAAARCIRRLGIGGMIGIDLPTLPGKAERLAAAARIDAALPQPFERTAVNGFGFVQIVRRRQWRSLPEMIAGDADGAAARLLLRRAERSGGAGAIRIGAAPGVIARLRAEEAWIAEAERRSGRRVDLKEAAGAARWGGHVSAEHP